MSQKSYRQWLYETKKKLCGISNEVNNVGFKGLKLYCELKKIDGHYLTQIINKLVY